jgi:hypothetical protein
LAFQPNSKSVPVLITWDIDPDPWIPLDKRSQAIHTVMDICRRRDIHATFFVTAGPANELRDEIEEVRRRGHEIGCHGLTHGTEENYDQMPKEMQRSYIAEATERLEALTGDRIRVFRAPRVKVSALTLKLLTENGYLADSSVCSQRIDLVSSNLINLGWVFAPRRPYRPHSRSAFRVGCVPIWEIPVSATVAPFISTTLKVFGLRTMKALFRLLYVESRHTGKPIVYLAHHTEFLDSEGDGRWRNWRQFAKPEHFRPSFIRAHGLRLRNLLYRVTGQTMIEYTRELLDYISSLPDITFMTIGEYTARILEQ